MDTMDVLILHVAIDVIQLYESGDIHHVVLLYNEISFSDIFKYHILIYFSPICLQYLNKLLLLEVKINYS